MGFSVLICSADQRNKQSLI